MFTLDASVPAELGPLSWLVGIWEGTGVIDYKIPSTRSARSGQAALDADDPAAEHGTAVFGRRVSFSHDGLPYLNYSSSTWLLPGEGDEQGVQVAHAAESGYWRLSRRLGPGDPGPAMLPATGPRTFTTADEVETLRNADGGFDIEVAIIHPTGVSELYLGEVKGPRIDLSTDAVVRSATAKEYSAATRLYGLVDGHLLWAWDIAALGQGLRTHASARLARLE